MLPKYRKFDVLQRKEKFLFLEALLIHLYTGLLLKIIPFRWIPRVFSSRQFEPPTPEEDQSRTRSVGTAVSSLILRRRRRINPVHGVSGRNSEVVFLVKDAIARAGVVSPWRNKCLVSSLAGRCMLRRRKIESQISLGVAKNTAGRTVAHAWLKSGNVEVVERSGDYTVLYTF